MALLLSSSSPQVTTTSRNACWVVKKVRDRDFDDIFEPIEQNPSLVWETNSRGWTCLHIACATIIPERWWGWLLHQACIGHEKLRMAETENGQTPIELYFRSNLFPYPWQDRTSKESAKQLKDSMSWILCTPNLLDELRHRIVHQDVTMIDCESSGDQKEIAFQKVLDFWQRMECLLTVAYYGRLNMTCRQKLRTELAMAFANLSWCPQVVAELGIRLFPSASSISRALALQALEIWASTKSTFERYPEGDCGSLPVLCQYYLFATSISSVPAIMPIKSSRPLNNALRMGKRWSEVRPLFQVFPDTICARDDDCGLPVFCLPAMAPVDDHEVEMAARWGGQQTGVWHYLSHRDKERELVKAREEVDREKLETIYQLLKRNPSALLR